MGGGTYVLEGVELWRFEHADVTLDVSDRAKDVPWCAQVWAAPARGDILGLDLHPLPDHEARLVTLPVIAHSISQSKRLFLWENHR